MPSIALSKEGISPHNKRHLNSKDRYRLVVLGSAKVGKTAIIHQFLYDDFPIDYSATVEELHCGQYEVKGSSLTLDILDTSGEYEFPAMRRLAIQHADAFILVFSLEDAKSFEEVRGLRELILQTRKDDPFRVPIVVVGNKSDSERRVVRKEIAETVVTIDWENGYVESSAKSGQNVVEIFQEVLNQSRIRYALSPAVRRRRRRSLPIYGTQPRVKHLVSLKRNSCSIS